MASATQQMRRRRSQKGAAAVEFALLAPVFILLVCGLIQFGWYFYAMQSGTSAVGEATRRMAVGDCQTSSQLQTMLKGRLGSATSVAASGITVTRTYTKADGATSTAAPGEIGGTVTLTATYPTFNLNLPLMSAPNGGNVTRSATARIEDVTPMAGGC